MKIVLDESVSYGLAEVLRHEGHEIIAIAESKTSGNSDEEVFSFACKIMAVLITRDYHFTNPQTQTSLIPRRLFPEVL